MAVSTLAKTYSDLCRMLTRRLHGSDFYSTGTISTTGTAVTGSSTVFPSWAANGVLAAGTEVREVSARGGDTSLTLAAAFSSNQASGTAYGLFEVEQDYVVRELLDHLEAGILRFYGEHDWDFLEPWGSVDTVATYSTGTVTISSGVVTFSDTGNVPSWAADGELVVDGTAYEVATRDSGSQVTLEDTSVDADAGTSFTLRQIWYDLPDDFGGFTHNRLYYRHGDAKYYPPIDIVNAAQLYHYYQHTEDYAFRPHMAALRIKTHDATAGSLWQLGFWRPPDAAYQVRFRYRKRMDEITPTNLYPGGNSEHSRSIMCAVMAEAFRDLDVAEADRWENQYEIAVERSKRYEANFTAADTVGPLRDTESGYGGGADKTISHPDYITYGDFSLFGT